MSEGASVDTASDWKAIIAPNIPGSTWTKAFQRPANGGGHLTLFISLEPTGLHASISHRTDTINLDGRHMPGRLPTWDEIKDARYRFLPDDRQFALILPPQTEYVNFHLTTMHLWEMRQGEIGAQ